jgi:glutamyl-tRNA reductase
MVVATSGSTFINYNIIISSSSSPYSVLNAKTFRDTISPTTRSLYALYIIDLNNAVSLIYDSTSSYTYLANIDF